MTELDDEFKEITEAVNKAKNKFYEILEKHGTDIVYYPIRIIVYGTDGDFKPIKKIIEIDDRELEEGAIAHETKHCPQK